MDGRPLRAQCSELARVVVGDLGRVEAAHAVGDFLRPAKAVSIGTCWSSSIPTSNAKGFELSSASAAAS
ncbi:hypothetical protein I553_9356 [Mycobacterium xenopi 4042]|uniref:Uncharacterized protein n=1 Tax=Mycobacterium xenopi 4042 TaxID=1299334 RepID=X8E041_MYCXE|nr:hypothetical protein I553_9356 [Mycobacterium xenopi 4042]